MKSTKLQRLLESEGRNRSAEVPLESAVRRTRGSADGGAIADLPQSEMTPMVRSAVMQLMDELDRVSSELVEARQRVSELEDVADEDPLVPVLNRRGFLRELERTLAYAARYRTPGSLMFCDMDEFKRVNDEHGHAAGDAALRFVADSIMGFVRRSDIVGRLGGDEFAVVLHRAELEDAEIKARDLMRVVAERPLVYRGVTIPLSLSAGVTGFEHGDTVADVLERADKAMFAMKSERR